MGQLGIHGMVAARDAELQLMVDYFAELPAKIGKMTGAQLFKAARLLGWMNANAEKGCASRYNERGNYIIYTAKNAAIDCLIGELLRSMAGEVDSFGEVLRGCQLWRGGVVPGKVASCDRCYRARLSASRSSGATVWRSSGGGSAVVRRWFGGGVKVFEVEEATEVMRGWVKDEQAR